MNADVKGLYANKRFWSTLEYKGQYLEKSEVKRFLEYCMLKGYKTIEECSDEEIERIIPRVKQ